MSKYITKTNSGGLDSTALGGFMVDSAFRSSKIQQISIWNSRELAG